MEPHPKKPFSWPVFISIALGGVLVICLYVFPRWFGFKKVGVGAEPPKPSVGFPLWFWIGLVLWGASIILLWGKFTRPIWFLHWSDLPLFWGFVLLLDGWVYKRNGGKSIISTAPQEIIGIGVVSMGGWMLFEFLNLFVNENWYYPKGDMIPNEQFLLYAILVSSGLMPLAFEWYSLFNTFPKFKNRYADGIKVVLPEWVKTVVGVLAALSLFLAGYMPDEFFFTLWLSPPLLLAVVLDKIKVWTPLKPIGKGNWSPSFLFALTYLVQGFLLEGQNYLSGTHENGKVVFTEEPAYWQYNLPYVNDFHIFEMPILGYFGYMPFGIYCWLWWIACGVLMGVQSRFYTTDLTP